LATLTFTFTAVFWELQLFRTNFHSARIFTAHTQE